MLLQTTKLQYKDSGLFVDVTEPNLVSCDVSYVNSQSREQNSREGTFTNETINSIEIHVKRGVFTLLDDSKPGDDITLKFNNGAMSIQGLFKLTRKVNTSKTDVDLSFTPIEGEVYKLTTNTGEGGGVSQEYVDEQDQSVLATCRSEMSEAKEEFEAAITELENSKQDKLTATGDIKIVDKKISLSGVTVKSDENGIYIEE